MKERHFETLEAMREFRTWLLGQKGFIGKRESSSNPQTGEYWVKWQDVWKGKVNYKLLEEGKS